jgi:DNA-binding CsgD family transcriptional regulator/tetratricopeptide (TPR) repeat protein
VGTHVSAGISPLEGARKASADRRWLNAYEALSQIDAQSALSAADLELLAAAAFLCGHSEECRQARLRAYQIYVNTGDFRRAARCAATIGFDQIGIGEIAQAVGCLPASMSSCSAWAAQGSALLEHEGDCAERGFLLVAVAYEQLVMERNHAGAASTAAQAAEVGRRFDDLELLAFALSIQGRSILRSGRVSEGMAVLDESVTVVATGVVSPPISGIVLSSAIDASEEAFDPGRFDEWTRALTKWCDEQQGMVAFRCRSLGHRAKLSQLHGRWGDALEQATQACEKPTADADPPAAAAALYRQGEVLRLRGELTAAEAAYGRAGQLGFDPQPGLALLRLAEGDAYSAVASINRALAESRDRLQRATMLPAAVEILLGSADLPGAAKAATELVEIAADHGSPALEAMAKQASGAVLLAKGDALAALPSLRQACRAWRYFTLTYEEGRARMLIARCCRMLGDADAAALEVSAARRIFTRLGARPDLAQTGSTFAKVPAASTHGLTSRELEVLRLVATGLTNRMIADELVVAVRTVDTHVSSILTKLGVSTRSAATSFAYRHHLV